MQQVNLRKNYIHELLNNNPHEFLIARARSHAATDYFPVFNKRGGTGLGLGGVGAGGLGIVPE